jgi:carbon monoxide dehydrogenase subunit G
MNFVALIYLESTMNLSDIREISADRQTVWQAILDAEVLKACIPGCHELTGSAQDGFAAVVVQKAGPVKATFKGEVTISGVVTGESRTLSGHGKGGTTGFATGAAKVKLSDTDTGGTLLEYDVEAKVGGKLAQLGSRIIDGFAKRLAGQFFERFQEGLEPEGPEDPPEQDTQKGWIGRMLL